MSVFPTKQAEISVLAVRMIDGYQDHASDFPHVNWILLMVKFAQYRVALRDQIAARAAVRSTVAARKAKLRVLVRTMKQCLKQSRVDTKDPAYRSGAFRVYR